MAKKHNDGYLSAKESRRISKENRKITNALEKKRKRKNVPESEYLTKMHDPNNAVEFDNLHTYFFTDTGVSSRSTASRSPCPSARLSASSASPAAANRSRVCRSCSFCSAHRVRSWRAKFA